MLICSLWTASFQKLPPSNRKMWQLPIRTQCRRNPHQQHKQRHSGVAGAVLLRFSGWTSSFLWKTWDIFAMGTLSHVFQGKSSLPNTEGCLSPTTPKAFGIQKISRHWVWRKELVWAQIGCSGWRDSRNGRAKASKILKWGGSFCP